MHRGVCFIRDSVNAQVAHFSFLYSVYFVQNVQFLDRRSKRVLSKFIGQHLCRLCVILLDSKGTLHIVLDVAY